jgi:putative transposase
MADYRRCYVPGGSFFFTVVTERRAAILGHDMARDYLRAGYGGSVA